MLISKDFLIQFFIVFGSFGTAFLSIFIVSQIVKIPEYYFFGEVNHYKIYEGFNGLENFFMISILQGFAFILTALSFGIYNQITWVFLGIILVVPLILTFIYSKVKLYFISKKVNDYEKLAK